MSWTDPHDWRAIVDRGTAELMNQELRDNMNETEAAVTVAAGDLIYATAAHALDRVTPGAEGSFLKVENGVPVYSPNGTMSMLARVVLAQNITVGTQTYGYLLDAAPGAADARATVPIPLPITTPESGVLRVTGELTLDATVTDDMQYRFALVDTADPGGQIITYTQPTQPGGQPHPQVVLQHECTPVPGTEQGMTPSASFTGFHAVYDAMVELVPNTAYLLFMLARFEWGLTGSDDSATGIIRAGSEVIVWGV